MSSLLPIRSEPSTGEGEPRVVDLDGEEAEEVFSALSSSTAREIVATLHKEPRTQSEIADELDTTVQNVRYHLDKLQDARLVEVVDTWYSSRGNEMSVYAPVDGALIVSTDEQEASRIRTALSRLLGGVALVGLASVVVQDVFGPEPGPTEESFTSESPSGDDAGPVSVNDAGAQNATVTDQAAEATNQTTVADTPVEPTTIADAEAAASTASGLPPGLLFFLGGVSVLVVVVAVAYYGGR